MPAGSNSARQAGESLLLFAFKHASIFETWGISELQNLNASPMQEERSSEVPWADKGAANTKALPAVTSNAAVTFGKELIIVIRSFSSLSVCIRKLALITNYTIERERVSIGDVGLSA